MRQLLFAIALRRLVRLAALLSSAGTFAWFGWLASQAAVVPTSQAVLHPFGLTTTSAGIDLLLFGTGMAFVLFAILVLMPTAIRHLACCPDILVPTLLLLPVSTQFMPWFARGLVHFGLNSGLQAAIIASAGVLLATFFAAWTTLMICSAVQTRQADAVSSLRDLRWAFPRLLPLMVLGWLIAQVGIPYCGSIVFDISPVASMLAIGLCCIVMNLATAALLPVVMSRNLHFLRSVVVGLETSILGLGRWLLPQLTQMVGMGVITWVVVLNPAAHANNSVWRVHPVWIGGYVTDSGPSRWYLDIAQVTGHRSPPLFDLAHILLFGILAIAVKIIIVQRMNPLRGYRHRETHDPFAADVDLE